MKKKIANWITHIIGVIMMGAGAYMIYDEREVIYFMSMFGLGALSFMSFNKLGDLFLGGLGHFLSNNSKSK